MIALPPKKVSSILRDLPGINQSRHSDSSVVQLCLILCDPMNYSTPGLPSITNSQSSPKLRSIKLVMPSNYLILYRPLLLLPLIPPSIRVFSNESTLIERLFSIEATSPGTLVPSGPAWTFESHVWGVGSQLLDIPLFIPVGKLCTKDYLNFIF